MDITQLKTDRDHMKTLFEADEKNIATHGCDGEKKWGDLKDLLRDAALCIVAYNLMEMYVDSKFNRTTAMTKTKSGIASLESMNCKSDSLPLLLILRMANAVKLQGPPTPGQILDAKNAATK